MTNHETVIRRLIRAGGWLHTYDFVGDRYGTLLSHRGPARVSELGKRYPEMVETDQTKRVFRYRFRFDNTLEFLPRLPFTLREFVKKELQENKYPYKVVTQVMVYTGDNTGRLVKKIETI